MRLTRFIPLVGCLLMLTAGCGGLGDAGGPASSDTTSAASSAMSTSSASMIKDPLDAGKLQSDPCSALTAAQLAPYMGAVRKNDVRQHDQGVACLWSPADVNMPAISTFVYPGIGADQLDNLGGLGWSERAADVSGYPTVHSSLAGDAGPRNGDCESIVPVSDHSGVAIYIDGGAEKAWQYYADACAPADELVAQVIANLKLRG